MWLILSFIDAIATGAQNAYFKKTTIQIHPIHMAWSVLVVSSLLFSPILLFGVPHLGNAFWIAIFARLIFDSVAFTLYIKALQMSPISLTVPMLSLQLIFVLLPQFYINHLLPSSLGLMGVFITLFGVYLLHFDHDTKHILSPFKAIYKEKGVLLATIVAALYGLIISLQKLGIDNSNPYFYTAFFQLFWALCMTPIAFFVDRKGFLKLFKPKMIKQLFPAGGLDAIQTFARYTAFSLAVPVYESSVSSTSIIFSSFFGWYFYKEKLKNHIIPTIIIVIGVVIISFAQK